MKLKSIVFALIPAAFMLLLLSCGGTPLTPEEALTKRAESMSLATSNEDWLEVHKYLSPRTREVCKSGEYAVFIGLAMGMLKELMEIPEDGKFTFSLLRVMVDGDIGRVYSEVKLDNEDWLKVEEEDNEGDGWVYVDGEWWQERDDWETTCGPDDL
jgi:hypothetical protein